MMGIHLESLLSNKNVHWLERKLGWKDALPFGSFVIDVAAATVYECSGSKVKGKDIIRLSDARFLEIYNLLPSKPRDVLRAKLERMREAHSIRLNPSARIKTPCEGSHHSNEEDDNPNPLDVTISEASNTLPLEVRDAFLIFMVELLGTYQDYVVYPSSNLSGNVYRMFSENFQKHNYLAATSSAVRPLLMRVCDTQMFASLIQLREEGRSMEIVFFEKAVAVYKLVSSRPPFAPLLLYSVVDKWMGDSEEQVEKCLSAVRSSGSNMDSSLFDEVIEEGEESEVSEDEEDGEGTNGGKVLSRVRQKRREIFINADLHLHSGFGFPLIIPGPEPTTVASRDKGGREENGDEWPTLDVDKLSSERSAATKRLAPLWKLQLRSSEQVCCMSFLLLIRWPDNINSSDGRHNTVLQGV